MAVGDNCCFVDMDLKRGMIRETILAPFKDYREIGFTSHRNYYYFKCYIKTWLGECVKNNINPQNKILVGVEPRNIEHNPCSFVYKMYRVKSNDVNFYFSVMDVLNKRGVDKKYKKMSIQEIQEKMSRHQRHAMINSEGSISLSNNTWRSKLDSYCKRYGILQVCHEKNTCKYAYKESHISLERWKDALDFFSEYDVLGVVGTYIRDRIERGDYDAYANPIVECQSCFSFKHHYVFHVLESDLLEILIQARKQHQYVKTNVKSKGNAENNASIFFPLKFYFNAENGRRYILAVSETDNVELPLKLYLIRIDKIKNVKILSQKMERFDEAMALLKAYEKNRWGVSMQHYPELDHIEMDICVEEANSFVLTRLEREKKCGHVEVLDDVAHRYRYSADVHDANELLPWIRSFIGYIERISCSSEEVTQKFYNDFEETARLYGE
jgi:hypothetical protein